MLFSLTYLVVVTPMDIGVTCYCFPTFKDLLLLASLRIIHPSLCLLHPLF
jgi:hypothetical protein